MPVRPYLSQITRCGRIQLTNTASWQQLTVTEAETLTSPVKIFVTSGYLGQVKVALANDNATQIRFIIGGDTHYFDECNSPHKLWIKPTVNDPTAYLYWRCGEE